MEDKKSGNDLAAINDMLAAQLQRIMDAPEDAVATESQRGRAMSEVTRTIIENRKLGLDLYREKMVSQMTIEQAEDFNYKRKLLKNGC